MKLRVKYVFIADVFFCSVRLRLASSCIWVNAVLYCSHLQLPSRRPFSPQNLMALFISPVHTVQ